MSKITPKEKKKGVPTTAYTALGAGGTAIYGGYVINNEKNSDLSGSKKYQTFSSILANTSIVSAGARRYLNLIGKATWKVEPSDKSDKAKEYAEKLEEIMYDMVTPWNRVVKRAALYKFYGFGIQEWTAKRRKDGTIGFLDIAPRPQVTIERWDTDAQGNVNGVFQRSPFDSKEIYLPRSKVIYMVDDTLNDSPEGLGLFRHIINAAKRLARYEVLEGFGFETDLRGIPLGRAPFARLQEMVDNGEITATDKTAMEQSIKDFIENHIKNPELGLLLDSSVYETADEKGAPSQVYQWDMKILQGGPSSQKEVADAITRLNHELARVMGVEGLLVGSTGRGSLALSKDKSHNFYLSVDSALTEIKETFEKDVIEPIWLMNGWPDEYKPCYKTEAIQFRDVEQITSALRDLALAGAPLNPEDQVIDEVRELMGLSFAKPDLSLYEEPLAGNEQSIEI